MEVRLRQDTEKNWMKANPKLQDNELVKVTECGKRNLTAYKIGNGELKYNELPLIGEGAIGYALSKLEYLEV